MYQDFLYEDGWFAKKYRAKLDARWPTMQAALNLLLQRHGCGATVVETGCMRQADDWGAGCSSLVFADFLSRYSGHLWSVDLSAKNVATCVGLLGADYAPWVTVSEGDSVTYLKECRGPIDLLYLDSYDYPYGDLLNQHGGQTDLSKATATLAAMSHERVVQLHGDLVLPAQTHCLRELEAALPHLHERTIILIDDNMLPGGGKPRLAKQKLMELGWHNVLDFQQTLWVKP